MSFIGRLIRSLTGRNGFNPKEHEVKVQMLKDETLLSWESFGDKLDDIQAKFRKTEEELKKNSSKA